MNVSAFAAALSLCMGTFSFGWLVEEIAFSIGYGFSANCYEPKLGKVFYE